MCNCDTANQCQAVEEPPGHPVVEGVRRGEVWFNPDTGRRIVRVGSKWAASWGFMNPRPLWPVIIELVVGEDPHVGLVIMSESELDTFELVI